MKQKIKYNIDEMLLELIKVRAEKYKVKTDIIKSQNPSLSSRKFRLIDAASTFKATSAFGHIRIFHTTQRIVRQRTQYAFVR